jgi:hypothetical protein
MSSLDELFKITKRPIERITLKRTNTDTTVDDIGSLGTLLDMPALSSIYSALINIPF